MGTAMNSLEYSRGVSMKALSLCPPSQPVPLFATPGHHLDKFIKDFLQPNKQFLDQITVAVKFIRDFLQKNCFSHSRTKVQKTVEVSIGLSPTWFLELCRAHPWTEGKGGRGKRERWAPRTADLSGVAHALLPSLTIYFWLCMSFWGAAATLHGLGLGPAPPPTLPPSPHHLSSEGLLFFLLSPTDTCRWI